MNTSTDPIRQLSDLPDRRIEDGVADRADHVLDAGEKLERALARVRASHASLREVLIPPPRMPRSEARRAARASATATGEGEASTRETGTGGLADLVGSFIDRARDTVGSLPVVGAAIDAVQDWWHRHPMRVVVESVAEDAHDRIAPVIRRHPLASVAISAGVAAAIVLARPWRLPIVSRSLRGAPQAATRWVRQQFSEASVQSIVASVLLAMAAARKAQETSPKRRPSSHAPDDASASRRSHAGAGMPAPESLHPGPEQARPERAAEPSSPPARTATTTTAEAAASPG